MIVDLPDTTVSAISKALVKVREEGGAVALGRVLTLVISSAGRTDEAAIEAANDASREHPMRVIVLSATREAETRLDAEIRVGGDAGASEVVVLHASGETSTDPESLVTGLLLPDAPVVVWWPGEAPESPRESPLGRIGTRRITDAAAAADPVTALVRLGTHYTPGDTDFAWTRLTLWRAQLAAVLDQPPYEPVTGVRVVGSSDSPSTELLAQWLGLQLQVEVDLVIKQPGDGPNGIHSVQLDRASGPVVLSRDEGGVATLTQPNQPTHDIALPRRSLRDCLAEELRRLDPDELFGDVVRQEGPTSMTSERRVLVHPDAASLEASVAARFLTKVIDLLDEHESIDVCLTGGSTGIAVLAAVAQNPAREGVDWSRVGFWWGDERYLSRGDADRNETQAHEALLDHLALPPENLHPFPAPGEHASIEAAADAYAEELGDTVFDITFLGVGPDGHVASLFPDHPTVLESVKKVVAETSSPKPPPERLSLTLPVINASERIWLVLAGADKAGALGLALADANVASVPVAGVRGRKRTVFFVDQDAAAEVPEGLIDRERYWTAKDEG